MEKAIKRKNLYTILSIASFVAVVLLLIPAYIMFVNANYMAIIPFLAVAIVLCYVNVFVAFAAYDARVALRVIPVIHELGADNIQAIADKIGWKIVPTKKFIKKCKKHGYV